ncbi:hypothetical protein C8R45DRAFT_524444 [Mycena sanguinolenta]|nr:hypothetical protein C8R45DRAFT_524444 [Mycena sanguinolenta]
MFSNSQQFTVTGGTFTNVTNNNTIAPSMPCDLRMFTIGDIDLRNEIRVNYRGVEKQARVRRIYSARVEGRKDGLTVALYQGDSAEEKWRQDIAKYMSMRFAVPRVQMVYTPRFSMVISYLFSNFWIVIEIPIFRQYIFMCTATSISLQQIGICILNFTEHSGHQIARVGYVVLLVDSAQSLPQPVIPCIFTGSRLNLQLYRECIA